VTVVENALYVFTRKTLQLAFIFRFPIGYRIEKWFVVMDLGAQKNLCKYMAHQSAQNSLTLAKLC
jgi:hypothetical protein